MAKRAERIYYWDACVFLAWLKQEQDKAKYLPHIDAILKENRVGKVVIITSSITLIEVWRTKLNPKDEERFDEALSRKWNILIDVDAPVARSAHDIQTKFHADPDSQKFPETPDAIHLATAILNEASEFHTFDNGNNDRKKFPLLDHTGHKHLGGIKITKPVSHNVQLFDEA